MRRFTRLARVWDYLFGNVPVRAGRPRRLFVEALEPRDVPAVFAVRLGCRTRFACL